MSHNNIDIDIKAEVDKKALAANLSSLSPGITCEEFRQFFKLMAENMNSSSSSGETIELDNGVKFTWERQQLRQ